MKVSYFLALVMVCITFVVHLTRNQVPPSLRGSPVSVPIEASFLEKELYYDWPKFYERIDAVTDRYGLQVWQNLEEIPRTYWEKIINTPMWLGFLPEFLGMGTPTAPWFEKISQGQVWRAFTPALLHIDLFHLVFNLFWLIALGRIVEKRTGISKYLLMTLVIGIVSNTAQYLMTGLHFYGYSGVVSGLFGYAYLDKKSGTPYPFPEALFTLTFIFILGVAALDTLLLFSPLQTSLGIANTAHLAGLGTGFALGAIKIKK